MRLCFSNKSLARLMLLVIGHTLISQGLVLRGPGSLGSKFRLVLLGLSFGEARRCSQREAGSKALGEQGLVAPASARPKLSF